MLATSVARGCVSIGSMPSAIVVPDTPPPWKGPRASRPPLGRPTASRVVVYRPVETAVCYGPNRFHVSRSLSVSLEQRHQFCQLKKTRAVQNGGRADAQHGHGRRIGQIGPLPRHGKRTLGSPLENQRLDAPDSPEFEDREPLAPAGMEWMGDFRRSRKDAAVRCSYR
jgi:hypothetical protein